MPIFPGISIATLILQRMRPILVSVDNRPGFVDNSALVCISRRPCHPPGDHLHAQQPVDNCVDK